MIAQKIYFSLMVLYILGCKNVTMDKPEVINFRTSFDMTIEKGKPNYQEIFDIKVVQFKDITLFIVPHNRSEVEYSEQSNGELKAGPKRYWTRYSHYIIEMDKKFGLRYDSLNAERGIKFKIDSVLSNINLGEKHKVENGDVSGKLVYSSYDKKTGKLMVEKYAGQNNGLIDSTYRYYDHSMRNVKFSLSPESDKKWGTKLVMVKFIWNQKDTGAVKSNKDVVYTQITRGELKNLNEIQALIKKYNQEKQKMILD